VSDVGSYADADPRDARSTMSPRNDLACVVMVGAYGEAAQAVNEKIPRRV
jgi:hypothetical protein